MRRLVFATQRLDPGDPILAATVPMVRALAARVDELVVLCDTAIGPIPDNVRVHQFGARSQLQRGAHFATALGRELRPRPLGFVAHMVPIYAVLAAPILRPLRIPLVLWYTQWKGRPLVRAAERASNHVLSVDAKSFPYPSHKLGAIGHGIDLAEFPCSEGPGDDGPLRLLALGRYSSAKGLETILRAAARAGDVILTLHGPTGGTAQERYKSELARLADELGLEAALGGPVPRAEVRALFADNHALVNNSNAGARDKVVYEAAAACLPVLSSEPVFGELSSPELTFDANDAESLARALRLLDRRRRPDLHEIVARHHSVEHWADGVLATVAGR